ncbi:MAG TPA: SDR family oxidoreductase [Caulobacteraceae bacterium]|jgi:NADP-dependent 3-hydroxy acid dehydrogenase YdfG|nr:SDR family oxidoreductase [Caulobacteraceae bacterium]
MSDETKVVVVTGAGAGAGRAIAARFGAERWGVALLSRGQERLAAAQREIEALGGEALPIPTDVSDKDAVYAARDQVMERWGHIDAWVNCAMATLVGPIHQLAVEDFKRVVEVTLMGYVHGAKAALEVMRPRNAGAIVQVGSALAYRAIPLQSAYCACKFAIRGFTDSLRAELIHEGSAITVSMLQMPGMNTIQFDWARNLLKDRYQPVGDVFDPRVAAEAAWRAVRDGPRELWVGGSAIQAIVGEMVCPPLLDRMVAKSGFEQQISHTPENPDRPDNLYDPVNWNVGARGRFGDRAKPRALTVDGVRFRGVLAAAALGLGAALTASAFAAGRRTASRTSPIFSG